MKEAIQTVFSGNTYITKNIEGSLAAQAIDNARHKPVLPVWLDDKKTQIIRFIAQRITSGVILKNCFVFVGKAGLPIKLRLNEIKKKGLFGNQSVCK